MQPGVAESIELVSGVRPEKTFLFYSNEVLVSTIAASSQEEMVFPGYFAYDIRYEL
jgi:hypothetical protein